MFFYFFYIDQFTVGWLRVLYLVTLQIKIMKLLFKILKYFFRFIFLLIIFLVFIGLVQYLCFPVYRFPERIPFSGEKIYNPYEICDSSHWKKSVFHIHSKSWGGITNGKSSEQEVFDRYQYLGYHIVALSDYQKINQSKYPLQDELIPNYEHGYGVKKNHQLNIGATDVMPFDFFFPQTTSNKQFVINLLRSKTSVLALAHPDWNKAITPSDVKRLYNYDCFEIISKYRNSVHLWDTALTAGVPVFLIANDDGHDIDNPNVVGRCLTLVYAEKTTENAVTDALRKGMTIGVAVHFTENELWEAKKQNMDNIPILKSAKITQDTFFIQVSDSIQTIKFIGKHGMVIKSDSNCLKSQIPVHKIDGFLRTEIYFKNGTLFYLNPIIRYNGINFEPYGAEVNIGATILNNLIFLVILILCFYLYRFIKKRRKKKKS